MGKIICFVGPSGIGKSSYIARLQKLLDLSLPSIVTTRSKRVDDNSQYEYVSEDTFQNMIQMKMFLEWDSFGGYFYGTKSESVSFTTNANGLILDLTPDGCIQVKKYNQDSVQIALLPDDPSWLMRRLVERGTNKQEDIIYRTTLLNRYIESIVGLKLPTIYCRYDSSTWDYTFAEIVQIVCGK